MLVVVTFGDAADPTIAPRSFKLSKTPAGPAEGGRTGSAPGEGGGNGSGGLTEEANTGLVVPARG